MIFEQESIVTLHENLPNIYNNSSCKFYNNYENQIEDSLLTKNNDNIVKDRSIIVEDSINDKKIIDPKKYVTEVLSILKKK